MKKIPTRGRLYNHANDIGLELDIKWKGLINVRSRIRIPLHEKAAGLSQLKPELRKQFNK